MEKEIGSPLKWIICSLCGNELPIFYHLDGKTKEPSELKNEICQKLENFANFSVVAFLPIESNLSLLKNKNDLSTDQKYLMHVCIAVSNGNCSLDLSLRNP